MPAAAVKFGPCIQGGCFGFEHNEVFFLCAKPALAVGGVESFAPCQNSPVNSVGGLALFRLSVVWFAFSCLKVDNCPPYLDLKEG